MSDFKNLEKSDEIKLLKWPECVRQRIGMYLSGTESTDNLLREIIDNSIDECYKIADTVIIDRYFNGLQLVADNGRGISIEYSSECREDGSPVIQADLSISALHSGSKFSDNKDATVGMNGVGSSAVNAVSENYILLSRITPLNYNKSTKEVYNCWDRAGVRSKKDLFYIVWYKKGYKHYEGAGTKKEIEKLVFGKNPEKTLPTGMSTIVMFNPDPEIFDEKARRTELPIKNLQYFLLIQEKFYKKKITINIEGSVLANSEFTGFGFEFTKRIIPEDTSMNPYVDLFVSFGVDPELATKEYYGSVNSLNVDTGAHITYMENLYTKALKEEYKLKHRYITNGLRMCVVVLAPEVTFNSQTKEKLKAFTKVKEADFEPVVKEFQKIFRKNPDYWNEHVDKLNYLADSMKNLGAADKAQRMIDAAAGNSVYRNKSKFINDFVDATGTDRWNCELFICFPGETEILTCNNEKINFVDLTKRIEEGERIYTFSCTSEGQIVPARIIRSEIKKEVSELCKVVLDNGESFRCTPDHKIMMRDGTYKEAKDLVPDDSLMPCYITESSNCKDEELRRVVLDMKPGNWKKKFRPDDISKTFGGTLRPVYHVMSEHEDAIIDESAVGNADIHRHHMDKNRFNDYPNNILICSREKHFSFHNKEMSKRAHEKAHQDPEVFKRVYVDNKRTDSFKKKASESHKAIFNTTKGDKLREHLREKAVDEWKSQELRDWRSKETAKYAKEHPEWAKKNSISSKISFFKSKVIPVVEDYISKNNLEFTSKSYNLAILDITKDKLSNKMPCFETLVRYIPDIVTKFTKVDNDGIDYLRAELTLKELEKENSSVTLKTFNEKFIELFEKPLGRNKISGSHRGAYLYTKKYYPDLLSEYEAKLNNNHKVISVEFMEVDNEPVYCLEVDAKEHNFPLAAGVFVKNCEGKSPYGALKAGRKDSKHHAILALRGKVLNTTTKTADQALENAELSSIFMAIGLGLDCNSVINDCKTPEEAYEVIKQKSRYSKVCIATDADSDGSQISNLLLYAISKYARFMIDFGLVYVALSPIYEQNGKYYYPNDPRVPGTDFPVGLNTQKSFRRFKGLGALRKEDINDVFYNPATRRLVQVTPEGIDYFMKLMEDVNERKSLLFKAGILSNPFNFTDL